MNSGKLSIGVPSQIGSFYIFEDITKFHKDYPNIEITIISKTTRELLKLLESHEIDFVIDTSPIETKSNDLIIKSLIDVENSFVVKSDSNIDISKINSIKDLINYPLVLPIPNTDNRRKLDELFLNNGIDAKNIINIHTSEMIVGAIKKDLGIGYIIYDVVRDNILSGEFKKVYVKEKLPSIRINLVYIDKYLTIAPRFFIENYLKIKL